MAAIAWWRPVLAGVAARAWHTVTLAGATALAATVLLAAQGWPAAAALHPGEGRQPLVAAAPGGTISTIAGGVGGPGIATQVNLGVATPIAGSLNWPCGVEFSAGQLYVADNWTVRSVDPATGRLITPAGTAARGPLGDGGPAVGASVDTCGVTVDGAGNLVIADVGNDRIRVVATGTGTFYGQPMTAGDIYTVAGTGSYGYSGDGGPATSAQLSAPESVAVDGAGNLVIADTFDGTIRVVAAGTGTFYGQAMTAGDIYTVAGTGTPGYAGDGGPAISAELDHPQGVTVDSAGNLVVADAGNSAVRVVAASTGTFYGQPMTAGNIYTVAGAGTSGYSGDGGPAASALLSVPAGVAVDGAGNLVIADTGNNRIRVVAASTGTFYGQPMTAGNIYTVAGSGAQGFTGDQHPATGAELNRPQAVTVDGAGNLVIADTGNGRVRAVAASTATFYGQPMTAGDIYTVAGSGPTGFFGDRGPATASRLALPSGVAVDRAGNPVIADTGNNRIRVAAAGTGTFYGQPMTAGNIYTVAGSRIAGYSGDGGPSTAAELRGAAGVTVDGAGNLVIADTGNNRIRVVATGTGTFYGQPMTAGDIYTVAGTGTPGYSGDGGPAASAKLGAPETVAVDSAGNLVIADTRNSVVRVVAATTGTFYGQPMIPGNIYTVAGTGALGYSGDGGPATSAALTSPQGVAVDRAGNLVIADSGNYAIRVVAATTGTFYGQPMIPGNIYTVAGTGTPGYAGDGGPAASATLAVPASVTADGSGNLVIADYGNNAIRVVAATTGTFYGQPMTAGDIYTVAGTGTAGFSGDGGPTAGADLHYPQGVAVDAAGDVLVADSGNNRVRLLAATPVTPGRAAASRALAEGTPAAAAAAPAGRAPVHAADSTTGPFVTLLFSRTEITAADNCVPDDSGVARLDTVVAPYLRSLGMAGTGTLVTGQTQATAPLCTHSGDSLGASWADAAGLARSYGWSFVSHTATYPNRIGQLTPTQTYAETCGSAAAIDSHGLPGGHGLIAYPGLQAPPMEVQSDYGAHCFAWGRTYNPSGTTPAGNGTTPPYWQDTEALTGGACHVTTAPCSTVSAGSNGHARYTLPSAVIAQVAALKPGQWFTLQAYLLVTSTSPPYAQNKTQWDCTSPNPSLHWTNDVERYCYSDWQQIVNAIAAIPGVTVTDPLTVGVAFGRPASYP